MPALMTDGKTSTAADLASSSRAPPTRNENSRSVASTSASIWPAEAARLPVADPIERER